MTYQALYRRYRPQRFSDFVGQEAVIRTLRAQVMSGRIAHAYLFCGTRGTGKTSAAKVFARAINCEHPANGEACGECATCRALLQESNLDILEIDAASNNGVDEIRELRENIKYPPQIGRFRVYIIDEVHMLSTGAFNALLKTLEEPPAHAKFILATTEPQKLPATILSRCQRFNFSRIPAAQISARLAEAMEENGIAAEPQALSRIARAAEGGMRDAWSIADMCLGYAQEAQGGLTDDLVREVLGAADSAFLFRFMKSVIAGDTAAVIGEIDEAMRAGLEVQVFLRDICRHVRALLLAAVCGEDTADVLEVTAEDAAEYREQASTVSQERLMNLSDLFLRAEADARWAQQPRFALETAALRACLPEAELQLSQLSERIGEVEKKIASGALVPAAPAEGAPRQEKVRAAVQKAAGTPVPGRAAAPAAAPAASPVGTGLSGEAVWKSALQALRKNPMIYGLAMNGRFHSVEDGLYTIAFEKGAGAIHVNMLNDEARSAEIAAALTAAAGTPCRFRAVTADAVPDKAAEEAAKKKAQENLDRVIEMFGRENVRVID